MRFPSAFITVFTYLTGPDLKAKVPDPLEGLKLVGFFFIPMKKDSGWKLMGERDCVNSLRFSLLPEPSGHL